MHQNEMNNILPSLWKQAEKSLFYDYIVPAALKLLAMFFFEKIKNVKTLDFSY